MTSEYLLYRPRNSTQCSLVTKRLYIYMYIYKYIYTYTYTYICVHIYIYTLIHFEYIAETNTTL